MLSKNLNVPSVPPLFDQIDLTLFNSIACAWPDDPKVGTVLEILRNSAVEDVAFPFVFLYFFILPLAIRCILLKCKKEKKRE